MRMKIEEMKKNILKNILKIFVIKRNSLFLQHKRGVKLKTNNK